MWCSGELECPGCKFKTQIPKFRPPKLFEPTIVDFTCATCGSKVRARLEKPKMEKDRTRMRVATKMMQPSALLVEMLKEDEEFKSKSIDEQEAQSDQSQPTAP